MSEFFNSIPLNILAASLADMTGVSWPEKAEPPLSWFVDRVRALAAGMVDRVIMYHSDAIPMYIYQKYTHLFEPIFPHVQISIPFISTVASVTPVAHASMYTGAEPSVHGIQTYVRPQLEIDTLYDVLIREGRKPAVIAMEDSTFLHIFKGRPMDFYTVKTGTEAMEKALELIAQDKHDFISIHSFEYDNAAHATGPESQRSLDAVRLEADVFARLATAVEKQWASHKTLIGYAPDHGMHLIDGNRGMHGSTMPEDMNIMHFYGVIPSGRNPSR